MKNKDKEREAIFHPEFREDLRYWVQTNRKVALKAFDIIEAIMRDPFTGIGKPEPLKYLDPGTWSRRLTQEHRIVYLVKDDRIDLPTAKKYMLGKEDTMDIFPDIKANMKKASTRKEQASWYNT